MQESIWLQRCSQKRSLMPLPFTIADSPAVLKNVFLTTADSCYAPALLRQEVGEQDRIYTYVKITSYF